MKKLFSITMVAVCLLLFTNAIQAQTTQTKLDQVKLMLQALGTWQGNVGKDTVQVRETKQYGKSYISNVSLDIKGIKSPSYISNFIFDSKESNFKGFILYANGSYRTFIGLWTTEKKLSINFVQDFKPEPVYGKVEFLLETPAKITVTSFNSDGIKTLEYKLNKVK